MTRLYIEAAGLLMRLGFAPFQGFNPGAFALAR